MIRYTLKCDRDHSFDSWFQSASAFDKLREARLVSCTICGSAVVEKAVMAPRVRPARSKSAPPGKNAAAPAEVGQDATPSPVPAKGTLSAPASAMEQKIAAMRARIEASSEDVGPEFAREARAIHAGDAPARPIIGEARPAEAKRLIEDGIPVAPLPWSGRKSN